MDWLEFWASIAQSLAWPVVILIVVVVLRKSISGALSSIASGVNEFTAEVLGQKFKVSREIGREVAVLAAEADDVGLPKVTAEEVEVSASVSRFRDEPKVRLESPLEELALAVDWGGEPKDVVLETWAIVERYLREFALSSGVTDGSGRGHSVRELTGLLYDVEVLDAGLVTLVNRLRSVRNEVVIIPTSVNAATAEYYYDLALRVLNSIAVRRLTSAG